MAADPKHRLIFANQLRGLAALCVVAAHLVGVFWAMPEVLGAATASPPQLGTPPALFALVSQPWFNPGPFGVGVFFLISGLVIPISLARHTRQSFILARILRIFPTYIAALVLEIAALHGASRFWGLPMPFGSGAEISNLFLVYDLIGRPSIDLVNWTLCAELKFYLVMALIAGPVQRGRVWPLFAVAFIIVGGNMGFSHGWFGTPAIAPVRMVSLESVVIVFMLIGVLFNYHLRRLLDLPGLLSAVGAMLVMFVLAWRSSELQPQFPVVTTQYLLALGVFGLAYGLRRFARPIALLDGLAAISFPLYLVHLMLGTSALKLLMLAGGLPYLPSLAISLVLVVIVAVLLHLGIERQSTAWGSRLAIRPLPSRSLSAS